MQELEFVVDREEEGQRPPAIAPTGWETVVFIVTDDDPQPSDAGKPS